MITKNKKSENKDKKYTGIRRHLIEWGVILTVMLLLYITGYHTTVIGTMQRVLLATGLITPTVPAQIDEFPKASGDFHFTDENNQMKSITDFQGDVVFLNVWATWCPPCIAEMPSIESLYENISDVNNISFVMVSTDEDFEKAKEFMEERDYGLPVYHYRSRSRDAYSSTVVPTTYVITPDGRLALEKQGFAKYDTPDFEYFLRRLAETAETQPVNE